MFTTTSPARSSRKRVIIEINDTDDTYDTDDTDDEMIVTKKPSPSSSKNDGANDKKGNDNDDDDECIVIGSTTKDDGGTSFIRNNKWTTKTEQQDDADGRAKTTTSSFLSSGSGSAAAVVQQTKRAKVAKKPAPFFMMPDDASKLAADVNVNISVKPLTSGSDGRRRRRGHVMMRKKSKPSSSSSSGNNLFTSSKKIVQKKKRQHATSSNNSTTGNSTYKQRHLLCVNNDNDKLLTGDNNSSSNGKNVAAAAVAATDMEMTTTTTTQQQQQKKIVAAQEEKEMRQQRQVQMADDEKLARKLDAEYNNNNHRDDITTLAGRHRPVLSSYRRCSLAADDEEMKQKLPTAAPSSGSASDNGLLPQTNQQPTTQTAKEAQKQQQMADDEELARKLDAELNNSNNDGTTSTSGRRRPVWPYRRNDDDEETKKSTASSASDVHFPPRQPKPATSPSDVGLSRTKQQSKTNEEEEDVDDECFVPEDTDGPVPYTRFLEMWHQVEQDIGLETEGIEASPAFRRANSALMAVDDAPQAQAQYGRLLFRATDAIFSKIAKLRASHCFVDIGHGIGNTVLQAAYTVGCQSLGIELVGFRHERAEFYRDRLAEVNYLIDRKRDGKKYSIGKVRIRHGSLHAPEHRDFLTKDVDVALFNNFGDVFGYRSVPTTIRKSSSSKPAAELSMDDYLVGLFTQMKEGAVLITLSPLPLCPSLHETIAIRSRHGLFADDQTSKNASFYTVEEYELSGSDLLSWTQKPFVVYKYTRVGAATFLCCNPQCRKAQEASPIVAFRAVKDDNGKVIAYVLNHCDCRVAQRSTRTSAKFQCPRFKINVP